MKNNKNSWLKRICGKYKDKKWFLILWIFLLPNFILLVYGSFFILVHIYLIMPWWAEIILWVVTMIMGLITCIFQEKSFRYIKS